MTEAPGAPAPGHTVPDQRASPDGGQASGPVGTFILLFAACSAAAVLAAAGIRSDIRYRASVDRALTRYAGIAAWELAEDAGDALREALRATLWPATRFGVVGADGFPPVDVFASVVPDMGDCPCPLPVATRFYFRYDLSSHRVDVAGESLPPPVEADLAALAGRAAADAVGLEVLLGWPVSPDGEYLALTTLPDRDGVPAAVYGAAISPAALVPVFQLALDSAQLLPASILPRESTGRVFIVGVSDSRDVPLFTLTEGASSGYVAESELAELLGDLHVTVRLSEAGAADLASGSTTPIWLTIALLAGVAVLFWSVVRSVLRERELGETQRRFVAAVSHDLRTPLTQIRMYAETLRLGRTRNPGDAETYLRYIDEEAHRLTHMIENVLVLQNNARSVDAGDVVDVGALASEEVERFRHVVGSERVEFDVSLRGSTFATAPAAVVRRVVANLLDNAAKFGPPDQTVRILVEGDDSRVVLTVGDEGPGIPPADRERVFDPFERLDTPQSRGNPGTGVGLTVVKDLIGALGGTVRITDAAAGGTSVIVDLPASRPPVGTSD